jgi:oligopeptide transport system substrate-binding protein
VIASSRLWRAIAVAVLVMCSVTACNTALTQGPKLAKEQTLRLMLEDQPSSLDPGQTQYSYETAVLRAVAEPLLKPVPDLSGVVPAAAESYEVVENGTVYVFHLRTAAKYWDGVAVKAQDYVYAWRRLIDPRLASPNEVLFANAVLNGDRVSVMDPQRDAGTIDAALGTLGLKALDDFTFQVTLTHPSAAFVWLAALPAGAPIRQDVLAKSADKWATAPETFVTNGPFKMTDMVQNDHIRVVRNPYYWGARPTLTAMDFEIVHDGAVALSRYKKGDLDAIVVQPAQASTVVGDAALKRQLVQKPDLTVYWIVFRVNSPPLDNQHVRAAVAEAIDRDAFVAQVFQGQGMPMNSFIPRGMRGYTSSFTVQKFDVAQARASLAAAGLSAQQLSLTFAYDQGSDFGKATAKFVHDQLKANLGVEINLQPLDANTLASRQGSGQFQMSGPVGWTADYPDQADWYDTFLTTSSNNVAFWQNQQYDNFVRVARTDTDPARRDQEYLEAQTMLVNDVPAAFMAQSVTWYLVPPYVRGVTNSPLEEWPGALAPAQLSVAPH